MKFMDLKTELSKGIKPIYAISGNDDYLLSQAIKVLKETLVVGLSEFNYLKLDVGGYTYNDFKNLLATYPLGEGVRLLVLENLKDSGIKAINEFSKCSFYGVVVAILDCPKGVECETINCDHLDAGDLKKWLKASFLKNDLKVNEQCYEYFIEISNGDMGYINSEIKKVLGYYNKGETVELETLKMLLTKNENYFVYNLTNSIDKKDKKSAIRILNSLQENISLTDIFIFMGSYFRKMFYLSISNDDQNISKILKLKPYNLQKSRENILRNGKTFYVNKYEKYLELDYSIKSGKISPLNAIYSLIIL